MAAMKPTKTLLVLALMLVPAVAFAQRGGYYSQPQAATELPGGFHNRMGRLAWGFSIGLGGMHDAGSQVTSCNNCNYNPLALEFDAHLGGFLGPRFALMGEFQVNGKTVQLNGYDGDTIITTNTKGLFRLKGNPRKFSMLGNRTYGLQFDIREAL